MKPKRMTSIGVRLLAALVFGPITVIADSPPWKNDIIDSVEPTEIVDISVGIDPVPNIKDLPESPPRSFLRRAAATNLQDCPDFLTPEIAEIARGVVNDPRTSYVPWAKLFLFVADNIDYEHYYGCKKGAQMTLLERGGNDADTATLLVAMLREAGYVVRYGVGVEAFFTEGHPRGVHLQDMLGLENDATRIATYNAARGFPRTILLTSQSAIAIDRVWVEINLEGTWVRLDPSVKRRVRDISPLNVASLAGYDRNALLSAAGGTEAPTYVESINVASVNAFLDAGARAVLRHIADHLHDSDARSLIGGFRSVPYSVEGSPHFTGGGVLSAFEQPESHDALPARLLSHLSLELKSDAAGRDTLGSLSVPLANLRGRKISLGFTSTDGNGRAQVFLDDAMVLEETTPATGSAVYLSTEIAHPHTTSDGEPRHNSQAEDAFRRGSRYAFSYGFNPSGDHLKSRQRVLEQYRANGLADDSHEVVTETLNVLGLSWMHQSELFQSMIGSMANCDTTAHHRMGRVCQESGYFIDVSLQFFSAFSMDGNSANRNALIEARPLVASSLESGVIEQMFGAQVQAVSTVKLIKLANALAGASGRIYYGTPGTWSQIRPQLQGYSTADLGKIDDVISVGGDAVIPRKGDLVVNQWQGGCYFTRVNSDGRIETTMGISGSLNGGYASILGLVDPRRVAALERSNPQSRNSVPILFPLILSADPVDMATLNYYFRTPAFLTCGEGVPRGLSITLLNNSGRAGADPTGVGNGWTHSWDVRATRRSAYEPVLAGAGTPLDVAIALFSGSVLLDLAAAPNGAKVDTVAALVADWLTSKLQDNAVSISIADRSLQFVRDANGLWQAPAGVTSSLLDEPGGEMSLVERYGNKYRFDSQGRLEEIRDQWGEALTVAYSPESRVSQVTDAHGRSLSFVYQGERLTSVGDSTGRSIGFTQDESGDLVEIVDEESKSRRFTYDGHKVADIINNDGQIVARTFYGSTGRAYAQHLHGDPEKLWQFYWTPDCTIEVDPKAGKTCYVFDDRRRPIEIRDARGNRWLTEFDGQDRKTSHRTPLGYLATWAYDARHNVVSFRDQDGGVATTIFDNRDLPVRRIDQLGREALPTFNDKGQLLSETNANGETTAFAYDPSTGVGTSQTDPAGNTTHFGYNLRLEHVSTTFPDGAVERWEIDDRGNRHLHISTRGFATQTSFNSRSQPLVVTHPDGAAVQYAYDNQGNRSEMTDERGHTTRYFFSPSGKHVRTLLPFTEGQTPQTAEIVKLYDERDWHSQTINELGESTFLIRNAAGDIIRETDALGNSVTYIYDADRRLRTTRDQLGRETSQELNGRGNMVGDTDEFGLDAIYEVDALGRAFSYTNRRDRRYSFGFDNADRPSSTLTPEGRSRSQVWNSRGLPETVTEFSGETTRFTYDSRGFVASRSDSVGASTFEHDAGGNLETVTMANVTIRREWDSRGRPSLYDDGEGNTIVYGYDEVGNLTRITYEPGKSVLYGYDERNRPQSITDWMGRETRLFYDAVGRLIRVERPNGTARVTTWDKLGQPVAIHDLQFPSGEPVVAIRVAFDPRGLPTRKFELPAWPAGVPPPVETRAYDGDNWITEINGDQVVSNSDGAVTQLPAQSGGDPENFFYDARERLSSAHGVSSYRYDAEDVRRGLTTTGSDTTTFVQDPHSGLSRVLWKIAPDGRRTFYIYGTILLYEIDEESTVARYFHYDHFGSTIALTNDEGEVTGRVRYGAYGELTGTQGEVDTPFLWNGAFGVQRDPNGLYYMRARYYHPRIGRFLTQDPRDLAGGSNAYSYALANPIALNDPSGEIFETLWDAANVGFGIGSFINNVTEGKVGAASLDAVGVIIDVGAVFLPLVPGGAGTAIRTARAADAGASVAITPQQIGRAQEIAIEAATGWAHNTQRFEVNGRLRVPDYNPSGSVSPMYLAESKNVQYQSLTTQLQDYADLVGPGGRVDVILPDGARVSRPLQEAFDNPRSPLNRARLQDFK